MRKAIWALPVATVLATAIGIPTAYAATGTLVRTDQYDQSTDSQISWVSPMHVGDCDVWGNLIVGRPASNGIAKVRWVFTSSTSHTNNFDQWHNSWKFLDSGGRQVGTLGTVDGLRMPDAGVFYS